MPEKTEGAIKNGPRDTGNIGYTPEKTEGAIKRSLPGKKTNIHI
jgi:hypothetical protein